jgi:hypothetical protein
MAGGSDKVEKGVNPVVAEAGVTLDTRLFRQDIIVLALDVASDFTKAETDGQYVNGRECLDGLT